jgi:glutamate synthase (NADPH/NADH) large chain
VWLREVVTSHLSLTGSVVAARVLDDWGAQRWLKIFPKDFKRVLAAMQRAADEGLDPDKLVMEAAHG